MPAPLQRRYDLVHNCIDVFEDLRVRKANHFDAKLCEAVCALTIGGEAVVGEVGVTVDLDRQLAAGRVEIDHERVDAVLPAELHTELLSS